MPPSILLLATSNECVVEAFCGRGRPHIKICSLKIIMPVRKTMLKELQGRTAVSRMLSGFLDRKLGESSGVIMKKFIGMLE
jgi:hypothetical protein